MIDFRKRVMESVKFINGHLDKPPQVGLLTGTGLGESAASLNVSISLAYEEIPNFPLSTVQGHHGRLIIGDIHGCAVMAMQGRFHLYEGYSPAEVTFPIRVMQESGIRTLILSNAAGGLNPRFNTGDIMLIKDHINLTGANPLVGPNDDRWGIRFPDMANAYDKNLLAMAEDLANSCGIELRKGIYVGLKGPSLETPAEIMYLRTIGAEAVGFSTVQEVIAAVHGGMQVLGFSTITNVHNPENPVPATVEEIIEVAAAAAPVLEKLTAKVVGRINETTNS